MKTTVKNWIWFLLLMGLILGVGLYLGNQRRTDLGKGFNYSLDEFRQVDPTQITYRELKPLHPQLKKIVALAVTPNGKIYVSGENGIEILGDAIFPVEGTPTCLAVDDDGAVFAGMQNHVEIFSKGKQTATWAVPNEKSYFTSIAVDDRWVYVADAGNRCIWRYKKTGGTPFEIGQKDAVNGVRGFNIPSPFFDLAIGTDGSLWVVNPGYHALENYHSDGSLISSWEASSFSIEGFSGCCNPSHFALLPDGGFVTAEKGLPRVKIHNVDGSLRCVVAAPDQFDPHVVGLDVATDEQGRIYLLDPNRNQIRIFEEKK